MKKLTAEQSARAVGIHSRAVDILHRAGWSRLRAFTAAGSRGTGESFEVWQRNGRTAIVQFYAEAGGVELYQLAGGNMWSQFEAAIQRPDAEVARRVREVWRELEKERRESGLGAEPSTLQEVIDRLNGADGQPFDSFSGSGVPQDGPEPEADIPAGNLAADDGARHLGDEDPRNHS